MSTGPEAESRTATTADPAPASGDVSPAGRPAVPDRESAAGSSPAAVEGSGGPPDTDCSWVARCARQFRPADTDRAPNLVGEDNRAMPDPGGE